MKPTDSDIVDALRENAERCQHVSPRSKQIACRSIGLDVALSIKDKSATGREIQIELDRGFEKCRKLYEKKDFSKEDELIGCVSGLDAVTQSFGYRTSYDRETGDWTATPGGDMNSCHKAKSLFRARASMMKSRAKRKSKGRRK